MAGNDKRMLGGWSTFLGVIGVFAMIFGVLGVLFWPLPTAASVIAGAFGALMMAKVLEWMGEVEHHLSRIAEDTARSMDRMNGIGGKLDQLVQDKHIETVVRAAQRTDTSTKEPTEAQPAREAAAEKPHPSGPKMYDAKAVADMYRRSQGGSNPARDFIDGK